MDFKPMRVASSMPSSVVRGHGSSSVVGGESSASAPDSLSFLDTAVLSVMMFLIKHKFMKMPERMQDALPAELTLVSDPVRKALQRRVGSINKFTSEVVDTKWNAVSWCLAILAAVSACALVLVFIFGEGLSNTVAAVRAMRPDFECVTAKCGYPAIFADYKPETTVSSEPGDPGGCECAHPTTFGQQCNATYFHTAQYLPYAPEALLPCPFVKVGSRAGAIANAPDRTPSAQLQMEMRTMWKRPGPSTCRIETKEAWEVLNGLDGGRTCLFHAEMDPGHVVPDFCPYNYRIFMLNDEMLSNLPMLVNYAVVALTEAYKGGHVPQFSPRLDRTEKSPLSTSKADFCEGIYTGVSCFFDSPSRCGSDGSDDLNERALIVPAHGKMGAQAGSWTISEKDIPAAYTARGLFWWTSQLARFFWTLNDKTMDVVEALSSAIGMRGGSMIAMHVSHHRDCTHNRRFEEQRRANAAGELFAQGVEDCLPFSRYMDLAMLLKKRYGVSRILMVSDNHDALTMSAEVYSQEFEFVYAGGVPLAKSEGFFKRARKIPGLSNFDLENKGLTQVTRVELMSRCHFFVGAFSNPLSRMTYQLMVGKKGFFPPFMSVDGEGLGNGMFDRSVHTDQLEKSRNDVIKKANEQAGMLKALRDYHGPGGRNG